MRTLNILNYTFTLIGAGMLVGAFALYSRTTTESCGTRLTSCFFGSGVVKTGGLYKRF